jgi:pimeloyl-ACP methyl ester carboxylesterase
VTYPVSEAVRSLSGAGIPVSVTLQLSWDRAGSGEPLLLLHCIGTTHADFAALRPGLDADYDVLAPDLPGHGGSAPLSVRPTVAAVADAVEADLDTLGLGRVHVLGSSFGARLALELAIHGRAQSVVAIGRPGSACRRSGSTRARRWAPPAC